MQTLVNPFRAGPHRPEGLAGVPDPSVDAAAVARLLALCPAHGVTPLVRLPGFGGAGLLLVKDERGRMGLGSFKALGAAYVIACDAVAAGGDLAGALDGQTYVTASAGNHGMSVAAGARVFGARAVIYLADTVPQSFADRLTDKGATVVRAGADYAASMAAAMDAAPANGWQLLSDSSWPGYIDRPHRLMEGYLQMATEVIAQCQTAPSHVLLQAGVGGLAGAVAAVTREAWGAAPVIVVVEPDAAPALFDSIRAGRPVVAAGPVSAMGRLDCKEPSLIALRGLARDADLFVTITEDEGAAVLPHLVAVGLETSASGGAGVAALIADAKALEIDAGSAVLCILSEGPA